MECAIAHLLWRGACRVKANGNADNLSRGPIGEEMGECPVDGTSSSPPS